MVFFKVLGNYFLVFFFVTIMFLGMMNSEIFLGREILFFRGLKLLFFSGIVTMWLILKLKKWIGSNFISLERLTMAIITAIAINTVCFVLLPVTFDRSVSMYLLNQLKNSGDKGLQVNQLIYKMESEYVEEKQAVERRVGEQLETGFVESKNTVKLTDKGKKFLDFSEIVGKLYGLDN